VRSTPTISRSASTTEVSVTVVDNLTAVTEPRRFFLRTFGCQMNEHDSERIAGLLQADGLVETSRAEDADVVVLNTCCIRENADNKLYGTLGHLKSVKDRKPGMQIMVAGCLAQKDRTTVTDRAPYVDVVLGTHNVHRAADLLHESRASGQSIVEILEETVAADLDAFPSALPVRRQVPWAGWVTIQIGCDNSCAFCIVPSVRGKEISRPFTDIINEVRTAAAEGVTEVTLLGQNVNSYGRDLALAERQLGGAGRVRPQFDRLLREIGALEGIRRVRYTSPHPKDLSPETIAAMAETPAVCEHLHLPLQSGSDRVLAAMHRGYTADRYLERLRAARQAMPGLAVTTDVIVGFPGETDDDFERTLEVVAEAAYDSAYTFIYSPRPGTEAAERTDLFVAAEVVAERFERLHIVVERSGLARHEARIGHIEEVLVEGPSRKDPAVLSSRTEQNKLLHFTSDPIRPGSYATVRVTGAAPHHLRGELVEVVASPSHKTRLPLLLE
jgi:tRNA-2-methylthio-N6-dimethylallyladenosine synthase